MAINSSSRRAFLQATSAAAAATVLTARQSRAESANETIVVGIMGPNGRGNALANGFAQQTNCRIAYVCDVDERAQEKGAATVAKRQSQKPQVVTDFRKILYDQSVDALVVAAPNHWHAPATIFGCQAGKHVYVEKPCSHNPHEGEMAVAASEKHNRVVTMGNQRRSWPKVQEAVARVRKVDIGEVLYSHGWYNNRRGTIGQGKTTAVPSWLDFNPWQGPAPRTEYRDNLVHYNWHWFWDWGNGEIGNNGIHALDICRWGLGVDYPIKVTSTGQRLRYDDDQQTPDTHMATFEFPGKKMIMWEGVSWHPRGREGNMFGISFHGSEGTLVIDRGGYRIFDMKNKQMEEHSGPSGDAEHLANFLDCIRSGEKPVSTIEEAHKSTLLCHLGNIAHRTGTQLETDASNGHIRNEEIAQKYWSREYDPAFEPKV